MIKTNTDSNNNNTDGNNNNTNTDDSKTNTDSKNTNGNIFLVYASDVNGGIGANGKLPWKCREDLEYFKKVTSSTRYFKNAVIMGSKTYKSIGRPLPNRLNIVLSKSIGFNEDKNYDNLLYFSDPEKAVGYCNNCGVDNIFVIGGSEIYKYFESKCIGIYHTIIFGTFFCDTYFNRAKDQWSLKSSESLVDKKGNLVGLACYYVPNSTISDIGINSHEGLDEYQYLDLVKNILNNGVLKSNRTDIPSVSIFGHCSKWSLKNGTFPLLTTKKVFFRAVVEELLWFIAGSTNSRILESKGINIWKGNTTREFLDSRGLTDLQEGDIGAGYGFQWRHSGAEYTGHDSDYTGKGVDQLKELVDSLKNDPNSRRMIICSWNPSALSRMALPPCHVIFQVYVEQKEGSKGVLHSVLYQRSADVGLGMPFNIASYSLLTIILAHCCSLNPGTFTYYTGDTHIYENHIEAMKKQLYRVPRQAPKLMILRDDKDIFSLKYEDFKLIDYEPYGPIKMDMAV
jgi:dihydrofolate reductase/thymidylate synthase